MSEKKRKKGGVAAATAVAAVTAAGVMVGGAFASPDEILEDGPDAIVQTVTVSTQTPVDADGGDPGAELAEDSAEEEEKRGARAAVRKAVRSAPEELRAVVAVPLWGLGTVVLALLNTLWTGVLSPAASAVLSWLGIALMAALIFALAVKTVAPDLPLKKILNKRSLLCIGVLCLICGILDASLPFFWEDYTKLSRILKLIGSFVCTGVPVVFFLRRRRREKPREVIEAEPVEVPPPEPTMEEKEAAARKLITELADSVCPRAY